MPVPRLQAPDAPYRSLQQPLGVRDIAVPVPLVPLRRQQQQIQVKYAVPCHIVGRNDVPLHVLHVAIQDLDGHSGLTKMPDQGQGLQSEIEFIFCLIGVRWPRQLRRRPLEQADEGLLGITWCRPPLAKRRGAAVDAAEVQVVVLGTSGPGDRRELG
jgi:hypothetical protein